MKIIFAGTPEFAATALQAILDAGHEVVLVLTQPDRPAGRGMQLHPSAVKQLALARGIALCQPRSLKLDGKYPDDAARADQVLHETPHDVMVVAAYGLLLPPSVLSIPPAGCLNIHASLLPRWRGAAPIHRAIEAGDTETGITIMQMDQGLDTGAMLRVDRLPIAPGDTTGVLHDRLARLGGEAIVMTLAELETGSLKTTPQPAEGVTYADKIRKEEAALDFLLPAAQIIQRIRAFNPFPGAVTHYQGELLKIWQARLHAVPANAPADQAPGTLLDVTDDGLLIQCGDGVICATEIQKAGGKRMSAAGFHQARAWIGQLPD